MIQKNGVVPERTLRTATKIRKAIRDILLNKTSAGSRVFTDIATPEWDETLPAILIYPESETIELFSQAPREYKRNLLVRMECIAAGQEPDNDFDDEVLSISDALDQLLEQIFCEMTRDETFGDQCSESFLRNIEYDYKSDGALPLASARMSWEVCYYNFAPINSEKQNVKDDARIASTEFKVGHHDSAPDNVVEASDTIELQSE